MNHFKNPLPNGNLMQELGLLLQESHPHNPRLAEILVRHYGLPVYRFLVVLVEADAESVPLPPLHDLVCRSFIRALGRLNRFQEYADVNAWMFNSAYQTFLTRNSTNARNWGVKKPSVPERLLSSAIGALHFGFGLDIPAVAEVVKISQENVLAVLEADRAAYQNTLDGEGMNAEQVDAAFRQKWQMRLALITVPDEPIGWWAAQVQGGIRRPARFGVRNLAFWQKAVPFALLLLVFLMVYRVAFDRTFQWTSFLPTAPTPDPYYEQFSNQPDALPYATWKPELPDEDQPLPREAYLLWKFDKSAHVGFGQISDLVYAPNGSFLAFIDQNRIHLLFRPQGDAYTTQLEGPELVTSELALSPDGSLLAVGGGDRKVWLWEVPSGEPLPGWDTPVSSNVLAFSPDGQTLATANENYVNLWDVQSGTLVAKYGTFTAQVTSLAFSPDGAWIAVGNLKGSIWIQRVDTGEILLIYTNHTDIVHLLTFTQDGKALFSASQDQTAIVVELSKPFFQKLKGKVVRTFLHSRWSQDKFFVEDVALSPDGKTLLTATRDGFLAFWDTTAWLYRQAPLGRSYINGASPQVLSLAFSPDGETLSMGTMSGELEFWKREDVSEEVMALSEPLYFHRENTDIVAITYEIPKLSETSLEIVSDISGFDLRVPVSELLPFPLEFQNAQFKPEENQVIMEFISQPDTANVDYFYISQKKGGFLESDQGIAATAVIEPITIGDTYLEFVSGRWITPIDLNPMLFTRESPNPGTTIDVTAFWSAYEPSGIVMWQDTEYSYIAGIYSYDPDLEIMKEILLQFITSILAPEVLVEQVKASPDTSIVTYTVREGESCADIAARFGITTELIATLNQLEEGCGALIPGQALDIPYQGEFWTQVDLNCDNRKENIYLFHPLENPDDPTITGVALDVREAAGNIHRIWSYTAEEMGVISFDLPTFFSMGECEQFLVIRGSTPDEKYRTIIFRTNGTSVWPILDSVGWPPSPDGLVSDQSQTGGEPFTIALVEWGDEIEPGQCLNHHLRFQWTGERFEGFYDRIERGDCQN